MMRDDEDCGTIWAKSQREAEGYAAHDRAHEDPLDFWGECDLCAEKVEGEQELGLRCEHGNYIPNKADDKGNIITDLECPECEKALSKMVAADIEHSKHGI